MLSEELNLVILSVEGQLSWKKKSLLKSSASLYQRNEQIFFSFSLYSPLFFNCQIFSPFFFLFILFFSNDSIYYFIYLMDSFVFFFAYTLFRFKRQKNLHIVLKTIIAVAAAIRFKLKKKRKKNGGTTDESFISLLFWLLLLLLLVFFFSGYWFCCCYTYLFLSISLFTYYIVKAEKIIDIYIYIESPAYCLFIH